MLTKNSIGAEIVAEWIEKLRSGEFKQGQHRLRTGDPNNTKDNKYCCLGVLCELAVSAEVIPPPTYDSDQFQFQYTDDCTAYLPVDVMEWVGISSRHGTYHLEFGTRDDLTNKNDQGASFSQIADIIESNPKGMFVEKP